MSLLSGAGPEGIPPGIFGVIHQQRPKAALAAIHDWPGFGRLVEKSSAAHVQHVKGSPAATAAIAYWKEHKPLLLFAHLDDVDHAGHGKTWEGPEYKAAVEVIDGLIGQLVATVPIDKSLIVLVSGPGIAKGEIKTRARGIDMAPTVVKALGLKPHARWEGVPLR